MVGTIAKVEKETDGNNYKLQIKPGTNFYNVDFVDVIENLFKPFLSGDDDHTGLGLGLTIARRAIQLLEGEITLQNNPTVGCAFLIELPLVMKDPPKVAKAVSGKKSVQPPVTRHED